MSRLTLSLAVVLVIVVAALFLLGGRSTERPTAHVEKAVSLANLQ